MKSKLFYQILVLALGFILVWQGLSRFDFVGYFDLKRFSREQEEKIGELLYKILKKTSQESENENVMLLLDSLKTKICLAAEIDPDSIKIRVIQDETVNAFALPGRQIVFFTGLISASDHPEEVAGVMAHELAHITNNHVSKKIMKDAGFAYIASAGGGQVSSEILKNLLHQLSSTAFDRVQESEADKVATQTLMKSGINPEYFASFLEKLSKDENQIGVNLEWISTHPESKKRADAVRDLAVGFKTNQLPVVSDSLWNGVKADFKSRE